jgi:hypothetical protein
MDPIISLLMLFAVAVTLLISGIYLIFYKRKIVGEAQPPAWMLDLPEPARSVRLKEFNKQVPKTFTGKWFLEYWRGQRSLFNAWFTWMLIGQWLLIIIEGLTLSLLDQGHTQFSEGIFASILLLYLIMAAIILWRCAVNSTIFYKYVARIYAACNVYWWLSGMVAAFKHSL